MEVTDEFIKTCELESVYCDMNRCIVNSNGRRFLLRRVGECDYKACGGACCTYYHVDVRGDKKELINRPENSTAYNIRCSHCAEDSKCKIYKDRPTECSQFPAYPTDPLYWIVRKKCSIKFEIVRELKPAKYIKCGKCSSVVDIRVQENEYEKI